jgi:Pentapeptide repeats (8 copies)
MKLITFTEKELSARLNNFTDAYNNLGNTDFSYTNLKYSSLSGTNFNNAKFRSTNLTSVNFSNANLSYASFVNANLTDANFTNANLTGANFTNANLTGACFTGADLRHAEFDGAIGHAKITEQSINDLLVIAKEILTDTSRLKMNDVHYCDTVHCAGGWACTLIPVAQTLEKMIGWNAAACFAIPIPEFTSLFYSDDDTMLAFLRTVMFDNGATLRIKYLSENKGDS